MNRNEYKKGFIKIEYIKIRMIIKKDFFIMVSI